MWWKKVGNWDERKREDMCGEKYWDEREKKRIDMSEREEINEKNSVNFSNLPVTQLLTSITSTKFDVK